ncbi:putative polysaccharide biosynthesis protein [Ligilactobacillus salivarius]|uniref:putative polysaccharide biosynthesis protein n=1 Tax=Ligilactobacillus salivarius TaxID=1624 RepID=UPI0024BB3948|nr:polysaccharide biosynthesis protein [Ligilactobacillus salivarius]WHS10267.1 polysaccharide biosynthesis protein [Ligilactobacillus salivarius]
MNNNNEQIKKDLEETSSKEKMLKGSAWMTAGSIFSRILGAIYIIPWATWFGVNYLQANALFTKGYTVYALFLMLSTAGIPSAVGKQVAHYNSLNEYGIGRRLFKRSLGVMMFLGIISAMILWFIAPLISQGDAAVIPVYRSLAVTLLLIPVMSLTRGFFQGYFDMAPFAISQLVEQVARIVYMLAATYLITQVLHGSYQSAVVQSTFAAFIGAVGGLLVLLWHYWRKRPTMNYLLAHSNNKLEVSDKRLIKEILYQSIPFIIIGSTTTLYNLFDQFSFPTIMSFVTNYSTKEINALYALFAGNANKLIMITISVAAAMADTAIPLLSQAVTKNDNEEVSAALLDSVELFFFVMLPCSFGMAAVSRPLYVLFYPYDYTGIFVLAFSSYIALALGLFMVLAALLQGIYENTIAIKFAVIGMIVKVIIQFPLTAFLHVYGPLAATGIGMTVSNVFIFRYLYFKYNLNINKLQKNTNMMMLFSLFMFIVVLVISFALGKVTNTYSKFQSTIVLIIGAGIGGYIYAFLSLKARLADDILGARANFLRRILKIK